MKPILCILKVREIPDCLQSYEDAPIDKVYICGFKEVEIEAMGVFEKVVADCQAKGYTHLMMISDDATINNEAVAEVLRLTDVYGIGSGFCRLDYTSKFVNLSYDKLIQTPPRKLADYNLIKYDKMPHVDFKTTFTGFALTCMSLDKWAKYGFECIYDGGPHNGSCSDLLLSRKLEADGLEIWTNRKTEVIHEKIQASTVIGQTFFIGEQHREIIWKKATK
ncbi:MAG: hypothetical protein IPN33_25380 [Saprospiraceae bacterium]|nr:hypothetical protein [Saprospiraceae bacterium]